MSLNRHIHTIALAVVLCILAWLGWQIHGHLRQQSQAQTAMALQADMDELLLLSAMPPLHQLLDHQGEQGPEAEAYRTRVLVFFRQLLASPRSGGREIQRLELYDSTMQRVAGASEDPAGPAVSPAELLTLKPDTLQRRSLVRDNLHYSLRPVGIPPGPPGAGAAQDNPAQPKGHLLIVSRLPVAETLEFEHEVVSGEMLALAMGVTSLLVLMSLITARITRPLQQLAAQVNEFGRKGPEQWGQSDFRVDSARAEFDDLCRALNSMTRELARRQGEELLARQSLRRAFEDLDRIFHGSEDGMWVLDMNGVVQRINRRMCEMADVDGEWAVGHRCHEVFAGPHCGTALCPLLQCRMGRELEDRDGPRKGRDGHEYHCMVSSSPVVDDDGRRVGLLQSIRDITPRVLAEERLRRTVVRLQRLVRDMPVMMAALDQDLRFVAWNRECERVTGYSAREIVGNPQALRLLCPDKEMRQKVIMRLLSLGGRFRDLEETVVCKDGLPRILSFTSGAEEFPLPGWAHWGVAVDVTESRQASQRLLASLQEKEVLLKEVHHRVKNNLQIIVSLLHLQSSELEDPRSRELFNDCLGRVMAMALVHERLYKSSDLGSIDLRAYLESLIASLRRASGSHEVQVLVQCDALQLDIDQAVPIGLILNELITNALKHTRSSDAPGEVRVMVDSLGTDEIALEVLDNGAGLPQDFDPWNSPGLGFKLVTALTEQLGGRMLLCQGGGVHLRIRFPRA